MTRNCQHNTHALRLTSACAHQDLILDTKPTDGPNFVCSNTVDSCPLYDLLYPGATHDPVHNHMGAHCDPRPRQQQNRRQDMHCADIICSLYSSRSSR